MEWPIFLSLWLLLWTANGQSNICYANCKIGYCLPTNALTCTDCDLGLVNLNSVCIGGSAQSPPITYLKPTAKGLQDSTSPLNCSVTATSTSTQTQMLFQPTKGSTFTRSFQLSSQHIYLQLKLSAIIAAVGSAPSSPTLLFTVFTQTGQTIYTTVKSFSSSGNPVACTSNYRAFDVFAVNQKFASSDTNVLVEVRASGVASASVALSNVELYFGNCGRQCSLCSGPTNLECLSCRGLLTTLSNGQCSNCASGFYQDSSGICVACPVECMTCTFSNGSPQCNSCNSAIAFNTSSSTLGCATNYSKLQQASDLSFDSSTWQSSETTGTTATTCGYYSLVGGVSIGVAGSSLKQTFANLPAHTILYVYFTLFLIDQSIGDLNGFRITLDQQTLAPSINISAPTGTSLTNECGTSSLELISRQTFQFVHNASSAQLSLSFLKDYAGIRDVAIVVNNQTGVTDCYSQLNGTCTSCRNGLALINNTCSSNCEDGYYLNSSSCAICPSTCKTCKLNSSTSPVCLSCHPPLVLDGAFCVDTNQGLFAVDVVDNVTSGKGQWELYPRLQNGGIASCGKDSILGSSDIKFKFLTMKRRFTGLPFHSGVALSFQFYQIDDYAADESVQFLLNNKTTIYQPSNLKMDLCGNSSPDAIVPIYLTDTTHSASTLDFQVSISRMGKLGIKNLKLYLLNTPTADPPFTLEAVPTYSVSTPPLKGLTARLIFPDKFVAPPTSSNAFQFSITSGGTRRLLQTGGVTVQNDSSLGNREMLYLLDVDQDESGSQLQARASSPTSLYFRDGSGNSNLISQEVVSAALPRYVNMDEASVSDRSNTRNLFNFFRGCAILGLFIGIASFLVGMSAAFDDFLILCQVLFVHVFIQLADNPPSVRIPFSGLHIVQFLEWLPWEARQAIEGGIIPGDLYQESPLVYTQYYQDIVFARTIYQPILFLLAVGVLWVIMHVLLGVWNAKNPNVKYTNYALYYYHDYDSKRMALVDKAVRFTYFPIAWACVLQCTHFANEPSSFHVWNSILTIVFFIGVFVYPAVMFFLLRRIAGTMSQGTFNKLYEEVRVNSDKLYYYLVRYYKLLAIACIVGFLHAANPVIALIILLVLNLADALLLIFTSPLGMVQAELIEASLFYPRYPTVYHYTTIVQQGLFILLEILFLVLYGQRTSSSSSNYMGVGYAICGVVIVALLNGLLRLFWGFMKQAQRCHLERQAFEQSIEKEVQEKKDPQALPITDNAYKTQLNISKRELSRLNSKRMSHVSKIR